MKRYYKDPEQNAAFERCVSFLADMIEKYGGEIELPDNVISWDIKVHSIRPTNQNKHLKNHAAA